MTTQFKVITEAIEKRSPSVLGRSIELMRQGGMDLHDLKRMFLSEVVIAAYLANSGNQCRAAREMGVHRNTYNRQFLSALKYLGLQSIKQRRVYGIKRQARALVKPMPPRMPVAEYPTA